MGAGSPMAGARTVGMTVSRHGGWIVLSRRGSDPPPCVRGQHRHLGSGVIAWWVGWRHHIRQDGRKYRPLRFWSDGHNMLDRRTGFERTKRAERGRPGTTSATDLYSTTCTDRRKGPAIGRVSSEARPGRSGTDFLVSANADLYRYERRQGRRDECERSEHLAARVASAKPSVRRRPTIDLWRSEREA